MLMLPLVGFQVVSRRLFSGGRQAAREAMLLTLSRQVLLLIPAVLILPRFFGLNGVWAALPTADACASLATIFCLWAELRRLNSAPASPSAAPLESGAMEADFSPAPVAQASSLCPGGTGRMPVLLGPLVNNTA